MAETAQLAPGEMLDDKYRVERLLSMGGMGAVYIGTHVLLKKRVAIKVLRPEFATAADMIERFQREAIAASAIGHDGIISVTDMGMARSGVAFLVMELLEGRSLAVALKDEGPFAVPVACDVASSILSAVGAAHRAGIVHRDLKPENIFLARREGRGEVIKILDFGISSITQADPSTRLTVTGLVIGTPSYMSPEQARGDKDISGATDIYSTGVILYEMLSQAPPYDATNYNLLMFKILSGEYVPLGQRVAGIPVELQAIVTRAMALDARDRFASAEELAEALAPFRSGSSGIYTTAHHPTPQPRPRVSAPGHIPGLQTADTVAQVSGPRATPTGQPSPSTQVSRPLGWLPVLGAAAGMAVVAALLVLRLTDRGSTARAAGPAVAQAPTINPTPAVPPPTVTPVTSPVVIDFVVTPPEARIRVNGRELDGSRLTLAEASSVPVHVRVEAPAYLPYEAEHVLDRTQSLVLRLEPNPRAAKPDKPARLITDSPY